VVGVVPVAEAVARGSFAERVVVRHDDPIELLPEEVDVASGAALGLAATAALMAVEAVDPQPGEIVLVTGATGGVGVYVLQLAAERGASVIATGFPEDGEWLRRLGASSVYDYRDDIVRNVSEVLPEGIDALIDVVHRDPEELAAAASLLKKPGCRLATTQGIADVRAYAAKGITARNIAVASDPDAFRRLIEIAEDGWLMVPITRTFTLDDVDEGLSLVVSGEVRGKLSVRIGD
jgi:NADPH:quinone reductase-like Zn-dependent oxidoreductase